MLPIFDPSSYEGGFPTITNGGTVVKLLNFTDPLPAGHMPTTFSLVQYPCRGVDAIFYYTKCDAPLANTPNFAFNLVNPFDCLIKQVNLYPDPSLDFTVGRASSSVLRIKSNTTTNGILLNGTISGASVYDTTGVDFFDIGQFPQISAGQNNFKLMYPLADGMVTVQGPDVSEVLGPITYKASTAGFNEAVSGISFSSMGGTSRAFVSPYYSATGTSGTDVSFMLEDIPHDTLPRVHLNLAVTAGGAQLTAPTLGRVDIQYTMRKYNPQTVLFEEASAYLVFQGMTPAGDLLSQITCEPPTGYDEYTWVGCTVFMQGFGTNPVTVDVELRFKGATMYGYTGPARVMTVTDLPNTQSVSVTGVVAIEAIATTAVAPYTGGSIVGRADADTMNGLRSLFFSKDHAFNTILSCQSYKDVVNTLRKDPIPPAMRNSVAAVKAAGNGRVHAGFGQLASLLGGAIGGSEGAKWGGAVGSVADMGVPFLALAGGYGRVAHGKRSRIEVKPLDTDTDTEL